MNDKIIEAENQLVCDMQIAVMVAMRRRKIKQKDLAKLVGCSAQNISKFLREGASPNVKAFARMLAAMDEKFEFRTETLNDI